MHRAVANLLAWFALAPLSLAWLAAFACFSSLACAAANEPAPATQPVAVVASGRGEAPPVPAIEDGAIPITAQDPTWGNRTALVTIVELVDFQCPYCARASATVDQLKREYGPEKLRV